MFKGYTKDHQIAMFGVVAILALTFGFIFTLAASFNTSASSVDTLSATLETSCTYSINTTAAHTANIISSSNTPNIGNTDIYVACNDTGGFGS
jgi:hypothetical protein